MEARQADSAGGREQTLEVLEQLRQAIAELLQEHARMMQENHRLRTERDELLAAFSRLAHLVDEIRLSRGGGEPT
jgi:regulator of replication initiation timing